MSQTILNVDFGDSIIALSHSENKLYDIDRIDRFFAKCAESGVDVVNWRVSECGFSLSRTSQPQIAPGYLVHRKSLSGVLESYDPPLEAVKAAKKHNVKILLWITLFDSAVFGLDDPFFRQNPDYYMMDRSGDHSFVGIPAYSEPDVREHRLREIRELTAYGADGIYLCMRSHCWCNPDPLAGKTGLDAMYGYDKISAMEFQNRFGVNILKEDFDYDALAVINGEYLTLFFSDVARLIHEAGQEVWMGYGGTTGSLEEESLSFGVKDAATSNGWRPRVSMDWKWREWISDGLVDAVVQGLSMDLRDDDVCQMVEKLKPEEMSVPVFGFCSLLLNPSAGHTTNALVERMRRCLAICENRGFSGTVAHQSTDFEFGGILNTQRPIPWSALKSI
ncbi:MAG: hypothetical protein KAG97_00390 [Victivallales bacterium]|nr:hypothetical protein [Victivallales bacterium]